MANIISELTARIEEYRQTNKNPCKNYATQAAAERATREMALSASLHFHRVPAQDRENVASADYVVFYVESWGRWVGCINLSELLRRPDSTGGYLGHCKGFFTW